MNQPNIKLLTEITDISKMDISIDYLHPGSIFASLAEQSPDRKYQNFFKTDNNLCTTVQSQNILDGSTSLEESDRRQSSITKELQITESQASSIPTRAIENMRATSKSRVSTRRQSNIQEIAEESIITLPAPPCLPGDRKDVAFKTALRLLKRFFRNTYRTQTSDISDKKHRALPIEAIFGRMQILLSSFIPQQLLTQDLVYYTIGITALRNISKIPCQRSIKREIADFQKCSFAFSRTKLDEALSSQSLITLCCCIVQKSDDPRISILKDEILRSRT
ncbi:unnamed protein product [Moneuplotes crassus]|uniref:Uncharacterized protein n=1 Tax=Euplotes crassus TaxID=5936 RepID=A0AAD1X7B6_EUPCR|nr:unnamed protein product [Moneuplotes crassus]